MAFPLSPTTGQRTTESGIRYYWTGNSWDHIDAVRGQELIVSTTDPRDGIDIRPVGSVWRNTTTGAAYRMETARGRGGIFSFGNNGGPGSLYSNPDRIRQSFSIQTSSINQINIDFFNTTVGEVINVNLAIYEGEDSSQSGLLTGDAIFGANTALYASSSTYVTTGGAQDVSFPFAASLPTGIYTLYVEQFSAAGLPLTSSFRTSPSRTSGFRFFNNGSSQEVSLRLNGVFGTDEVWEPLTISQEFIVSAAIPLNKKNGEAIDYGDLWFNPTDNTLEVYDGGGWRKVEASYENALTSLHIASITTTGAINELDVYIDTLEQTVKFIGSYQPSTNTASFTALSGYASGVLPAANTLSSPGFLIVTEQAVGQAPAPAVPMLKGDYLIADPATNVWTHVDIGTAISSFLALTDTPSTYTGSATYTLRVNSSETGVEFAQAGDVHSYLDASAPTIEKTGDEWVSTDYTESVAIDLTNWRQHAYVAETSGTPPTAYPGRLWYDQSTSSLFIYDDSLVPPTWVEI